MLVALARPVPAWEGGDAPGGCVAAVRRDLVDEQDPVARSEASLVGLGLPAVEVTDEQLVGQTKHRLDGTRRRTDEDRQRLAAGPGFFVDTPPPSQEGVVAAQLVGVLVRPAGAVELDIELASAPP